MKTSRLLVICLPLILGVAHASATVLYSTDFETPPVSAYLPFAAQYRIIGYSYYGLPFSPSTSGTLTDIQFGFFSAAKGR